METKDIIKEILYNNNLSQEKLAKILNVSQKAISNWINGNDTPKASSMMLIYENFGITPNELLGIEEPTNFIKIKKNNTNEYFEYTDGTHTIRHKR